MNERAIMMISKLLDGYTEPPGVDWPKHEKEKVTFSYWALSEIRLLVWDHPWVLASETIEEFAIAMFGYAANAVSKDQRRIFIIAAETALEILEDVQTLES